MPRYRFSLSHNQTAALGEFYPPTVLYYKNRAAKFCAVTVCRGPILTYHDGRIFCSEFYAWVNINLFLKGRRRSKFAACFQLTQLGALCVQLHQCCAKVIHAFFLLLNNGSGGACDETLIA